MYYLTEKGKEFLQEQCELAFETIARGGSVTPFLEDKVKILYKVDESGELPIDIDRNLVYKLKSMGYIGSRSK